MTHPEAEARLRAVTRRIAIDPAAPLRSLRSLREGVGVTQAVCSCRTSRREGATR